MLDRTDPIYFPGSKGYTSLEKTRLSIGRYLGDRQPWKGTAADIFIQAQFPLHSGRILGLPGRILISVTGLIVAMLSVTGVVIWWKKRAARKKQAARAMPATGRRVKLGPDPAKVQKLS